MYVYYYNAKAIYDATAFEYGFTTRNMYVGEVNFQNFSFRRSFTMYENNFRTPTNSLLRDQSISPDIIKSSLIQWNEVFYLHFVLFIKWSYLIICLFITCIKKLV